MTCNVIQFTFVLHRLVLGRPSSWLSSGYIGPQVLWRPPHRLSSGYIGTWDWVPGFFRPSPRRAPPWLSSGYIGSFGSFLGFLWPPPRRAPPCLLATRWCIGRPILHEKKCIFSAFALLKIKKKMSEQSTFPCLFSRHILLAVEISLLLQPPPSKCYSERIMATALRNLLAVNNTFPSPPPHRPFIEVIELRKMFLNVIKGPVILDHPPFLHPLDSLLTQLSSLQLSFRFSSIGNCLLRTTPSSTISFQSLAQGSVLLPSLGLLSGVSHL